MRKWPAWLPNESCKIRTQAEQKLVQFLYFFQLRLVKLKNEYIPLANMSLDKSLCGIHKKIAIFITKKGFVHAAHATAASAQILIKNAPNCK